MIPLRVVGGIAAGVALTAFALGAIRFGPAEPAAPAAVQARRAVLVPEPAPVPAPAPALAAAHGDAAKAVPIPARASLPPPVSPPSAEAYRSRVAAGVLARAASLRAQDREAACVPPAADAATAAKPSGTIESVEIDWNAGPQDP